MRWSNKNEGESHTPLTYPGPRRAAFFREGAAHTEGAGQQGQGETWLAPSSVPAGPDH